MSRFDEAQSGCTPETVKLPLSILWEYGATRFPGNPSSPIVLGNAVYFASGDRVYAVDAATGALKWRFPTEQPMNASVKGCTLVADGRLYFGASDGNLYALNAEDGKLLWSFTTRGTIRGSPVLSGGIIYVGSDDDSMYAVDAETGENRWGGGFRTRDDVAMTPVVASGLVIFASLDGTVYGVNSASGKIRWAYRVAAAVRMPPVATSESVIIGAGNSLTALAIRSGSERWKIPLPADPAAAPAVGDGVMYVPLRNKELYAVSTAGKAAWPKPVDLGCSCVSPPTLAGDLLFVACERGTVSAYSTETGELKWRIGLMPSLAISGVQYANASSSPVVANGALYVLTDDGTLHCLRPDAVDLAGPEVYNLTPKRSAAMSGSPPITFSVNLFDTSTGIDPSTVRMARTGPDGVENPMEFKFDLPKWQISYDTPVTQPVRSLPDGKHEIAVTVADWRGNSTTEKWSVTIDNSLKPAVAPKPVEPPPTQPTKPGPTRPTRPDRNSPRGLPRGTGGGGASPTVHPSPSPPPTPEGDSQPGGATSQPNVH